MTDQDSNPSTELTRLELSGVSDLYIRVGDSMVLLSFSYLTEDGKLIGYITGHSSIKLEDASC